jgi:hypothetical protein
MDTYQWAYLCGITYISDLCGIAYISDSYNDNLIFLVRNCHYCLKTLINLSKKEYKQI